MLSETVSDHLHVIAEEVSRVAELCIGSDMGTMGSIHGDEQAQGCVQATTETTWHVILVLLQSREPKARLLHLSDAGG
jgi:hypothetical protein